MSQTAPAPILWRRLDLPGHDSAALRLGEEGAVLSGMAVFHQGAATALAYTIHTDRAWQTTEARVQGFRDRETIDLRVRRDAAGS